MHAQLTKLLVRVNSTSRDADPAQNTLINIPGKDPISIVETLPQPSNPWDEAHEVATVTPEIVFAEPEINSSAVFYNYEQEADERGGGAPVNQNEFIDYWPHPARPGATRPACFRRHSWRGNAIARLIPADAQ